MVLSLYDIIEVIKGIIVYYEWKNFFVLYDGELSFYFLEL